MKSENHRSTSALLKVVVIVGALGCICIGISVASASLYYGGYGVSCDDEIGDSTFEKEIPRYIAHAGGGINGLIYTNSLEALESSYSNGIRYFEIDVNETIDKKIVLRHVWDEDGYSINYPTGEVPTYDEYMSWDMNNGLTAMDFHTAFVWLEGKDDVFFIIDMKVAGRTEVLQILIEQYPQYVSHLIPQINFLSERGATNEYSNIRELGFEKIIVTYRHIPQTKESDRSLIRFVRDYDIFAVSLPIERAMTTLPRALYRFGVPTLSHTINDEVLLNDLESNYCVQGVYTDILN